MDKLKKNQYFFSSTLLGNVHEVVIDKVVVEILCGNSIKYIQNQLFQTGMIAVNCLDIEYSMSTPIRCNANVIQIHIERQLMICS